MDSGAGMRIGAWRSLNHNRETIKSDSSLLGKRFNHAFMSR
jgi:hypothetical protein